MFISVYILCVCNTRALIHPSILGHGINGLVTYGNTKLCCRGFVLAQFQSTTDYKLFLNIPEIMVCLVEILQVTVNKIDCFIIFLC